MKRPDQILDLSTTRMKGDGLGKELLDDSLMSARDLAKFFRVSERTIWTWKSKGDLPDHIEIGGIVRWFKSTILGFCKKREGFE